MLNTTQQLSALLLNAELYQEKIFTGKVGRNEQIRQSVRCCDSGKFIAFFCRNVRSPDDVEYVEEITTDTSIASEKRYAAQEWMTVMRRMYAV